MSYELTGKIKVIFEPQTFASGFTKRELVVTIQDGQYSEDISLEFIKDKISLLDNLEVGQEVTVSFNLKGREYNGRYYNNLQGWRIVTAQNEPRADEFGSAAGMDDGFDDVPF